MREDKEKSNTESDQKNHTPSFTHKGKKSVRIKVEKYK